jgi:hypothetical protein
MKPPSPKGELCLILKKLYRLGLMQIIAAGKRVSCVTLSVIIAESP